MIIRKRRKLINGFNITLLEKTAEVLKGSINQPLDTTVSGGKFIRSDNTGPQSAQTVQIETTNAEIQYLAAPIVQPQDDYHLVWDSSSGTTIWKPPTNYQPQFDAFTSILSTNSSNISELQTLVTQFNNIIRTDYVETDSLHIPFAVAWSGHVWGGPGKAGIFFHNPGDVAYDGFAIKMGHDNATIGETGYTYGTVGNLAQYPIVMRFTNGTEGSRGFVWSARGASGKTIPVMALDTNDPDSNSTAGSLKIKGNFIAERGYIVASGGSVTAKDDVIAGGRLQAEFPSQNILGPINISNYDPSTGNSLITMRSYFLYDSGGTPTGTSLNASHNNYVLTYTHLFSNYGKISLLPQIGGSGGGGTLPGVEIDCGTFTAGTADINCGSFV